MTTYHEAFISLGKVGPGAICDDCGHFARSHADNACAFPRPVTKRCLCKGMKWQGQRFRMDVDGPVMEPCVTCPQCDLTSYNPNDVEWGYCGNCSGYTGTVDVWMKSKNMLAGR
jgi:hypothetical protein